MNFFFLDCQSGPYNHDTFGICDPQDSSRAYVDIQIENSKRWTATVNNPCQKSVTFTAVDKCIIKDDEHTGRGRCDAMLTTENLLFLVELKDKKRSRSGGAIQQLESTIQFLLENHTVDELKKYQYKKVFVCNRKASPFVVIDNELQKNFHRNYGFKIDVQATILVIP
jgi:hypothetical protein